MKALKAVAFILFMTLFGAGVSFNGADQGAGFMWAVGFGALGGAMIIAWCEIRRVILSGRDKK